MKTWRVTDDGAERVPAHSYHVAEDATDATRRRPTLYLDTTIPSYLTSRISRNVLIAAHQRVTREWWRTRRAQFDIHVSTLVLNEASKGDATAAQRRRDVLTQFLVLNHDAHANFLATQLIQSCCLPEKANADASHIAVAAVFRMDYLLTWNCSHLANASLLQKVGRICSANGYTCPQICTPLALLGDVVHERSNR